MRAMVLEHVPGVLLPKDVFRPEPSTSQVLIKVQACGVCRTDLHVIEGDLPQPKLPLIPGHEIVGEVVETGSQVDAFRPGDRVGVPWLGFTCGQCAYCKSGRENLCGKARFTGYQLDGGYGDYTVADARFCFLLPEDYSDEEVAPLLCAGLIGYRALQKSKDAQRLGIYGFGAAAHIITQVARYQSREVYAFTRPGDEESQKFAMKLGCAWAGSSTSDPPQTLDAAILFAPVGSLVPQSLKAIKKGGRVVCAGIHMSPIPAFSYELLWGEREIVSVANLTRRDGDEFLKLAPQVPVKTTVQVYPLVKANEALRDLKAGKIQGAAVLKPDEE